MTEAFDLYGLRGGDIGAASKRLAAALGIAFEARASDYQGGDYYMWGDSSGEHFILKHNVDLDDDEPAELAFPDYPLIFYVNASGRAEALRQAITGALDDCVLLRHEDLA
jgi:hypothetical protein